MPVKRHYHRGFTLVEILVTVAILAVVVAVAVPSYQSYVRKAELQELADQFLQLELIINDHAIRRGYPADNHIAPPPGVDVPNYWGDVTEIGGSFNWEGPDRDGYPGIAVFGATAPRSDLLLLDSLLDDGDLNAGRFFINPNGGRPTYRID